MIKQHSNVSGLSPAAQTVWSAFLNHSEWEGTESDLEAIAAALRAVADQVVAADMPEGPDCCLTMAENIRSELLAIAAELEGGGTNTIENNLENFND